MKHIILFILFGQFLVSCTSGLNDAESISTNKIDPSLRDSLKHVILDLSNGKEGVPNDYLTHFGFRDWYRWPLVFPYSLNSIDT